MRIPILLAATCLATAAAAVSTVSAATISAPQPVPHVDPIPAARDVPYPGTMELKIDATDTVRGVFKVEQRIPVIGPAAATGMRCSTLKTPRTVSVASIFNSMVPG